MTYSGRLVLPRLNFSNITPIGDSGGDRTPFDSYQSFVPATKSLNKPPRGAQDRADHCACGQPAVGAGTTVGTERRQDDSHPLIGT